MGLDPDRTWDARRRRRFLKHAHQLWRLRGTVEGLRLMLLLYLGWEGSTTRRCGSCRPPPRCAQLACSARPKNLCACHRWDAPPLILEHFKLRRWLFLGEGRLGEQAVLWGKRIVNRMQLGESAQLGGVQLTDLGDPVRDPFFVFAHKFTVYVPAARARTAAQRMALERVVSLGKPAHTVHDLKLVEPRFRIGFQSSIGLDSVIGRYPRGFALDQNQLGYDTVVGQARENEGGPSLRIGDQARVGNTTMLD
jgi:hypothetical protein